MENYCVMRSLSGKGFYNAKMMVVLGRSDVP